MTCVERNMYDTVFSAFWPQLSWVCGQLCGYQFGTPDAFEHYRLNIDQVHITYYVLECFMHALIIILRVMASSYQF